MSDLGFHFGQKPRLSLMEALAQPAATFRPDARFLDAPLALREPLPEVPPMDEPATDPVADAYTQGFAAGYDQALLEATAQMEADAAAREKLDLSFARLDAVLAEELRQRLRETVETLCAAAIAPLAIDADALTRRIERAVAMLARADDERVIRLHPQDLAMLSGRLAAEWTVEPDATLERGTVRVETAQGGVEDGPATWRLAIAEALQRC